MATSLASRLITAAGKESRAQMLNDSDYFEKGVICQVKDVPIVNIMHGGTLDGGICPGIAQVVGDSRTFKTNFCLLNVAAFLDHDPLAVCVFIDCEFGATKYFSQFGIDHNRVIHIPVENLEEIKFQTVRMLDELTKDDKVIFFIDSISQIASKKEVNNAIEGNEAADMTRAREMNSFFRMITPKLNLRRIPMFVINSFYTSMGAKGGALDTSVLKGGKQAFLSSDTIFFVTRAQERDSDKELLGWNFNYNIMKSRAAKERSKFTLRVLYEGGIDRYSGLMDIATEGGFVTSHPGGWYSRSIALGFTEDTKRRAKDANCAEFWDPVISNPAFRDYIKNTYTMEAGDMVQGEEVTDADGVVEREPLGEESAVDKMSKRLSRADRKTAKK